MELFLTRKEDINLNILPKTHLLVVSFAKDVLEKYKDNPLFEIDLDENVGGIKKRGFDGWYLPIEVGEKHISTLLYKLRFIPEEERQYFEGKNTFPQPLGPIALE
ncbi:TPA: hypothetical protein ACTXXA_003722, partial [Legionella anisa]